MNTTIQKKMEQFKANNHARNAWLTADEWSNQLGMKITPQRLGSMYRAGMVLKHESGKAYWGDNKCRYDVAYKYTK